MPGEYPNSPARRQAAILEGIAKLEMRLREKSAHALTQAAVASHREKHAESAWWKGYAEASRDSALLTSEMHDAALKVVGDPLDG